MQLGGAPTAVIDLSVVKPAERFDYWDEFLTNRFSPHERYPAARETFSGEISENKFGFFNFLSIKASAYTSKVTSEILSGPGHKENFILVAPLSAPYTIRQDGFRGDLACGDLALLDTRLPGSLGSIGASDHLLVSLPRKTWEQYALPPTLGRNFIFDKRRTVTKLIRSMIIELGQAGDEVDEGHQLLISRHLAELISIAAAESNENLPGTTHRQALLRRMKAFVRDQVGNTELGPLLLAREFGVSTRYISKLFADQGETLTEFSRRVRLTRAAELIDQITISGQSIKSIAHMVGYKTLAHFSGAFSSEFGVSPKAYGAHKGD